MKTTTTILTIALITSLAGNAFQYTNPPAATPEAQATELTPNQPVTDEPAGGPLTIPGGTKPSQEALTWKVRATFAITYAVKPTSAAFQDGYTVTVYQVDKNPTAITAPKKPGAEAVTWAPELEGLPGVISVTVHQVEVTGGAGDKE